MEKSRYNFKLRVLMLSLVVFTAIGNVKSKDFVFHVKFKTGMSAQLKAIEGKAIQYSKYGYVQTGISSLDNLNIKYHSKTFKRVFRPAGKFEKRHEQFGLNLWYEIHIDVPDSLNFEQGLNEYKRLDEIENIQKVYTKTLYEVSKRNVNPQPSFIPNDPMFVNQWHYYNTGQTGGTPGSDISLPGAWEIQKGSSAVTVAVIDMGIDINHNDLKGALWVNEAEKNGLPGVDDDHNGYVDDINGYCFGDNTGTIPAGDHGTHVAGTIGAVTNNGIGVSGIAGGSGSADGVRLMSCAVFGTYSQAGFGEAFVYAADMGASIAQNSWGYGGPGYFEPDVKDGIDYFIANAGMDISSVQTGPMAGGLVIFAAGNSNSDDQWYPAYYDKVISVASLDHNSQKAYYSNYGSWVDIAAPGGDMSSVSSRGVLSTTPYNTYSYFMGTSMACPHVSGVAALVVSQFKGPGLNPQMVWDRLVQSADNIDTINSSYPGLLGTGRLNAMNSLVPRDTIPPAAISDLHAVGHNQISLTLSWTATGSSGFVGKATSYEMRIAEYALNEGNFNSAILVNSIPAPKVAGSLETFQINKLIPGKTYYVAIKAIDIDGYKSLISNIASAATDPAPIISIDPTKFIERMDTGLTQIDTLRLRNIGVGILDFSFAGYDITAQGNSPVNNTSYIQYTKNLKKDEADLRVGHPVITGRGDDGKNGFGYQWIDSREAGGPAYSWNEISTKGTQLSLGDDSYTSVTLPFNFKFYAQSYTSVYISSNGFITFNSSGANEWVNEQIPSSNWPNAIIAPFWDDLVSDKVYYYGNANNFIIQYQNVHKYSYGGDYTFQIILYPNGTIMYQYKTMTGTLDNATTGIENETGTDGLQIAFNTSFIADNLAVSISIKPDFIASVTPASGSVNSGNEKDVLVKFTSKGMLPGNFESELNINSNDPSNPTLRVPVTLHINGIPRIGVNPGSLNFGQTFLNDTASKQLEIINCGTDSLRLDSVTTENSAYFIKMFKPVSIYSGDTFKLKVYFVPTSAIEYNKNLVIHSNAEGSNSYVVQLTGIGLPPPIISVVPDSLNAYLFTGETSTQSITIYNNGGSDLNFDISLKNFHSASVNFIADKSTREKNVIASGKPVKNLNDLNFSFPKQKFVNSIDKGSPIKKNESKHKPVKASAQDEFFGSDDYEFSGSYRSRGNLFTCTKSTILNEHRIYLNPNDNSSLWFLVYEGGSQVGIYNLISASEVNLGTTGLGWYSSGDVNVPLIAGKYYLIITSFQNTADYFYSQNISPYPISASFGQLTAGAGWDWAPTTSFPPADFQLVSSAAFGSPTAYYQELLTNDGPKWLTIDSDSGTVPAGSSTNIEVTFNAADLIGGNYYSDIEITSNDPVHSKVDVPAYLHVTGKPVITVNVDSLNFGSVFSGYTDTMKIVIKNTGTDELKIDSIRSNDSHFGYKDTIFNINVHDSAVVQIWYMAQAVETDNALFSIFSNDSINTPKIVVLKGQSLLPPVMSVLPDSLSASLFTGDSITKILTIDNTAGGSQLKYNISINFENKDISMNITTSDHSRVVENSMDKKAYIPEFVKKQSIGVDSIQKILVMEDLGIYYYDQALGNLGFSRTLVTDWTNFYWELTSGVKWNLIVVNSYAYPSSAEILDSINSYARKGGSVIFATWDVEYNSTNAFYTNTVGINFLQTIFTPINFKATIPDHPIFQTPNNISEFRWSDDQGNRDGQLVQTINGAQAIADFEGYPGSGSIVVNSTQNVIFNAFQAINYNRDDNSNGKKDIVELIENEISFLIKSGGWLRLSATSGTVLNGSSENIDVKFDATGLMGGDYKAGIEIRSNDPLHSKVNVPVSLHVTGFPILDVNSDLLNFGEVFTGMVDSMILTIRNSGTDVLKIDSLQLNNSHFSCSGLGFNINPRYSINLPVLYRPNEIQQDQAILNIYSNSSDTTPKAVVLTGKSVLPPRISYSPEDYEVSLYAGENISKKLSIANEAGKGKLNYSIQVNYTEALNTGNGKKIYFKDGFESGNINSWVNDNISVTKEVEDDTVASGEYSLRIANQNTWGSYSGIHKEFVTDQRPDYLGFYIRPGSIAWDYGNLSLGWMKSWDYWNEVSTFVCNNGNFWVNGGNSYSYNPYEWYFIEFKNFNWWAYSGTFDYYVNGELINSQIQFSFPYPIEAGDKIMLYLYNWDGNTEAWWDNITIGNFDWLSPDKLNGSITSGGSTDINVNFSAEKLSAGDYKADISIISNDPQKPVGVVNANLHVKSDAPVIIKEIDTLYVNLNRGTYKIPLDSLFRTPSGRDISYSQSLENINFQIATTEINNKILYIDPIRMGFGRLKITATNSDSESVTMDIILIVGHFVGINENEDLEMSLSNYPNPFNNSTNITYELENPAYVEIKLYNVQGQLLNSLVNTHENSGKKMLKFNAGNLKPGIYLYELKLNGITHARNRMIIE
jgi:subtilisin family serine protease